MTFDDVILVDYKDRPLGVWGTLAAHQSPGLLHRAFSVVLWTPDDRIVLQRRAATNYLFGGLWSNSCSGHPRRGESVLDAAASTVAAELGAMPLELMAAGRATYAARDRLTGMVEREVAHVVIGRLEDEPAPDSREIDDIELLDLATIEDLFATAPRRFSPWFGEVLDLAVAAKGRLGDGRLVHVGEPSGPSGSRP